MEKILLTFTFVISYIVCVCGIVWLFKEPGWEPLIVSLSSLTTLSGALFIYSQFKVKIVTKRLKVSEGINKNNVEFYHSIRERQIIDKDVRGLITESNKYIFISGVSLLYVITKCENELLSALQRGVIVELVITDISDDNFKFYSRYSTSLHSKLPVSHDLYRTFHKDKLETFEKGKFKVYLTKTPISHSIGVYDGSIYISEFCLDADSSQSPSYKVNAGMGSYKTFVEEVKILLKESESLVGNKKSDIMKII